MPRVKKIKEEKPGDWQTVFCCLSIILVAFFVMLCSYATIEEGKMVKVSRSFKGAINIFPGGVLFEKGVGIVVPSPDTSGQKVQKIAAPIHNFLKGKGLEDNITLKSSDEYVSLILLESLLFDEGSAEIKEESKTLLKMLAGVLHDISEPVRIEGHTDDGMVGPDRFRSAWELSAMRAVNVLRLLQKEGNIPYEMLSAYGFAHYKPFVPGKTSEDRRRNRRVELIIPLAQEIFENRKGILREAPPSFKVWDLTG